MYDAEVGKISPGSTEPVRKRLFLEIPEQPDDFTCGATCLHAVYAYFGDRVDLNQLIREVPHLDTGGTLAVLLANHALNRGYRATIYSYNLGLFDPTWLGLDSAALHDKLMKQSEVKEDSRLRFASRAYLEYLALGGRLRFDELSSALVRKYLRHELPVLSGLSATYLYRAPREFGTTTTVSDDVRGEPVGHFVVLCGYDVARRQVLVADPLGHTPMVESQYYWVSMTRLLSALLLGVLTYDGNLLVLEPDSRHKEQN